MRSTSPPSSTPSSATNTDTDERRAAATWTRLAEGEDSAATHFVAQYGYIGALERVATAAQRGETRGDIARWARRYNPDEAAREYDKGCRLGAFLMPGDDMWPSGLEHLGDQAPLGLWTQGDPHALTPQSIAIVGSRAASSYGATIAGELAFELSERGFVIASGGALGIDAAAHRGAVAASRSTIVVFAGGVDKPYPAANGALFGDILRTGGVFVSEHPPGAVPLRHRFLSRNRIIAALSQACVVVEAPRRSGALSTAHHALALGREVGAVPGPITSHNSSGCHHLIRDGAACLTCTDDVVELVQGIEAMTLPVGTSTPAKKNRNISDLSPASLRIHDALARRAAPLETLAARSGLDLRRTVQAIGELEMMGLASRTDHGWRLGTGESTTART
ncbi:DNA-protecting protein DprA [Arcanobacterium haemolyticum]|nr:DNA-protecting protein DprA [Arcanobacterium haemolyticum]